MSSELFGVVYGLYDPRTDTLRYIGQTTRPIQERLKYHLSKHNLTVSKYRCAKWLISLVGQSLTPLVRILGEAYSREDLDALDLRRGTKHTAETRKKMSEAARNRKV